MSGLENILFAPRLSWTGQGDSWLYVSVQYIRQQTALFLVTHPVTLNLANSIKCVGDSRSYLSYASSLLCAPDIAYCLRRAQTTRRFSELLHVSATQNYPEKLQTAATEQRRPASQFPILILSVCSWSLLRMRNCQSMASTGNKFIITHPCLCNIQFTCTTPLGRRCAGV